MKESKQTVRAKHKKTTTRIPIEKILLGVIGAGGIIAMVAIAPGAAPALKMFGVGNKHSRYYQNAVGRLKQKGHIVFETKNGKRHIRITNKGSHALNAYTKNGLLTRKPKKWDKKWRIVTFDIPEKRRSVRDKVRRELESIGFEKLQNSVWIYPYECEEFVKLLKADKKIGRHLLYVVAERVEYDKNYREIFNL